MIDLKIISSPDYNLAFFGAEALHPFDTHKYGRAWRALYDRYGDEVRFRTIRPEHEVHDDDLLLVHSPAHLEALTYPAELARALELVMLANMPYPLLRARLIYPMRLATQGTIIAAVEAMKGKLAVNLSGGYHHASADKSEGFCLFADVPVAIEKLRQLRALQPEQTAIIVDLDAHQGNGHERVYRQKQGAFIFDMYNQQIWPADEFAKDRIDYAIGLNSGVKGDAYLDLLRHKLPEALNRVKNPGIGFYIAGTDIVKGDMLGRMSVSEDAVFQRDQFVVDTFIQRGIPLVIVLGGGYIRTSYRMIARMVGYLIEEYGDASHATVER